MSAVAAIASDRPRSWIAYGLGPALVAAALGLMVAEQPLLSIALVLAVALAVSVVAWPDLVTIAVVFLFFINAPGVAVTEHGAPVVVGLVAVVVLVVPFANQILRGRGVVFTPAFVLVLLFLVAQIASTVFAIDLYRGWENVKTFVVEGVLLYFLVTNAIRTPDVLRRAVWAVILGGGFLGGISLFQEVTGTYTKPYGGFAQVPIEFFTGHADKPRLAGPLGDPNYYAQILLACVPLALFMMWSERSRFLRFAALGAAVLAVAGILLSFSRGAGLAFVVIFLLMAFLKAIKPRYVVLVVVGLVVALMAVPAYKERITTVTSVGSATSESGSDAAADESVRSRMTEMLAAAHVFMDHPVIGVGPGHFPLYYEEYAEQIGIELREQVKFGPRKGEAPQRESHNMFLSVAADLGLPGFLLFAGILVVTLRELLRARRRWLGIEPLYVNLATSLFLAIIAYVTSGVFLTLAFERYFWLLVGLGGAAGFVLNRSLEVPPRAVEPAAAPVPPRPRRPLVGAR